MNVKLFSAGGSKVCFDVTKAARGDQSPRVHIVVLLSRTDKGLPVKQASFGLTSGQILSR
jgi:hypothetical protein